MSKKHALNDFPFLVGQFFSYDPETGCITRTQSRQTRLVGERADRNSHHGYRVVSFKNRYFKAHRLAWFLHYGAWPDGDVDHINGDRSDNRVANLRLATNSQNQANRAKPNVGYVTSSIYKGVSYEKSSRRWCAYLKVNGHRYSLGGHKTEISAAMAYDDAARKHFGEFARTNEEILGGSL